MNSLGLYIHIPFCRSRCYYCDFYSRCNLKSTDEYTDALCRLIESTDYGYDTVFVGGGTPTVLNENQWKKIFSSLDGKIQKGAEITTESNPCDLTPEYLSFLLNAGINRLSIGIQSLDDRILSGIGRRHTGEMAENAVKSAVSAGFSNISADFMLGLGGQTDTHIEKAVDFAARYDLTHLSCYMLKIEENTVFYKKSLPYLSDDDTADLYLSFVGKAKEAGFMQYEISNFAKPGYESRHNLKYWNCDDYLGLGPGAHSSVAGSRFFISPDTDMFIKNVRDKKDVFTGHTAVEYEKEKAMLGLRLVKGIILSEFSEDFKEKMLKCAEKYIRADLAVLHGETLSLTEKGFLVSNTVISDIVF